MGRLPRLVKPNSMYEIVVRTVLGRRLFRPVPETTKAVLDILGRGLALFAVQLHAFIYLSNHLHLLATFFGGEQMRGFMRHLNRNTAVAAKAITGWSGDVWERYCPIPVLDDLAAVRRLRYVLSNGVKEGLVEHPLDWPGASSSRSLVTGEAIDTEWRLPPPRGAKSSWEVIEHNPIELAPLPSWAQLSRDRRRAEARALMDDIAQQARTERQGKPVLGVAALRALDPLEPTPLVDTPPPLAHTSEEALLERYKAELRQFASEHRKSGRQQATTGIPAIYPAYAFPAALPIKCGE